MIVVVMGIKDMSKGPSFCLRASSTGSWTAGSRAAVKSASAHVIDRHSYRASQEFVDIEFRIFDCRSSVFRIKVGDSIAKGCIH